MSEIQDFFQGDSISQNKDALGETDFWLRPLSLAWDSSQGFSEWKSGERAGMFRATLPFGDCEITSAVDDQQKNVLRIALSVNIEKEVLFHSLEVQFRPAFANPDKVWVPHLRPGADLVMADQVFRSPAVLFCQGGKSVAMVPDLSVWPAGVRTWLDLQRHGPGGVPLVSYGLGHFEPTGHIFFKRMKSKVPIGAGTKLQAAFYLIQIPDDALEPLEYLGTFLWERFAPIDQLTPQVLSFKQYEELVCNRVFAPDIYHEFDYQKKQVGGMITQTYTSKRKPKVLSHKGALQYIKRQGLFVQVLRFIQSKMFTNPTGNKLLARMLHSGLLQIAPMVSFQSWFNQARTALGAALHAKRIDNDQMLAKAEQIIELALSAPDEGGCFPSVCFFTEQDVFWMRGTRAFELIDSFHLPDAAVTGFHLLEWHQRIKADVRILDRCKNLAQFFISLQDSKGAFPTWAKPEAEEMIPDERLKQCASAAAPAMMLARLFRIVPDESYLKAAQKTLAYIEQEVMPEEKWFDYELFYSCAGRPTGEEGPDPYTGCYPANTLSLYWATRAALDVYLATEEAPMLTLAKSILARLSLYQQVFDHPKVSINTFGGFGVMNADAEFNDARQGLFVPLYLDMYQATGEEEMLQRGIAALRSCFTTMLVEEHREVAPGNLVNYRLSDRGAILENYAHTGRDEVTAGYLSPDWGCGSSLYASGLAFDELGQVFVDTENNKAYGIDLCHAHFADGKSDEVSIDVEPLSHETLEVVVAKAGSKVEKVLVNGRPAEAVGTDKGRFRISF